MIKTMLGCFTLEPGEAHPVREVNVIRNNNTAVEKRKVCLDGKNIFINL